MDTLTLLDRKKAMRAVKSQNTSPEKKVLSALRNLKVEFVHQANLPGTPDFLLTELDAVLFVQGCFWHSHGCRRIVPKTNMAYWKTKLAKNVRRDRRVRRQLNRLGYIVLSLWECRLETTKDVFLQVRKAIARAVRLKSKSDAKSHYPLIFF